MRRDPEDRRRVSKRWEDKERTALLARWRRPPGLARLVAQINRRRLAARLGIRLYDPAAVRDELLFGATVDVYEYGPFARRARGYIDHLRKTGLNIGAMGRGRFKLLPDDARRSRSPERSAIRERLLAGETVRWASARERSLLYGVTRELRRSGHDVVCNGRGTRSYRLQLAQHRSEVNDSLERAVMAPRDAEGG